MKFSVFSWNVEAFEGTPARLQEVADKIRARDPDVFALYEVHNVDLPTLIQDHFPDYDFHITDGTQNKEILVGYYRDSFDQATFVQKTSFKLYNPYLRPGALLTVRQGAENHTLLFLHTDSGNTARDFGNRYEMLDKVWKMKGKLDGQAGGDGQARFCVFGDLNTMGLAFPRNLVSMRVVDAPSEIEGLDHLAARAGMRRLLKSEDATWKGSQGESDLDHVLATDNVAFVEQGSRLLEDGTDIDFHVAVEGWNQLAGNAQDTFLDELSDHSSLYVEFDD